MMGWFWIVLAAIVAAAGIAKGARMREIRRDASPAVDDQTIRRILEDGTVSSPEDEPLDLEEVARAEEEFWNEDWDEPEEFHP